MENDPYMKGLIPELKYFYFNYGMFRWDKDKTFANCLIDNMLELYDVVSDDEAKEYFRMFNIIIYDLSFNNFVYMLGIAKFSRDEIMKVFKVQAKYSNRLNINPLDRPLKGVMCISVANWLLKSRNDYNQDVIYKCIWSKDMISASSNMQLWMKKTKYLNDENEFKDEINSVGDIVDNFNITTEEKQELFNQIIQYWRYSIKEYSWSCEKERRYQIFLFDNYEYTDLELEETFLKVKTYLTMCLDFCNVGNYCKYIIQNNKERKMKIYTGPYYYCEDCLYHSFDELVFDKKEKKHVQFAAQINILKETIPN